MRIGRAFGLEMHAAASPGADSKTLAMMVPAANSRQDQDLRDIQLEDVRPDSSVRGGGKNGKIRDLR